MKISKLVVVCAIAAWSGWAGAQTATAVPASRAAAGEAKAVAQPGTDVEAVLGARKVVRGADGKETLVDAKTAGPGEILHYTVTYRSKSTAPAQNVEATLPVPEGMQFVPNTARPGLAMATLDGQKFELIPLKRKVRLPDGKEVEREVPAAEYKAIRWKLGELPPGKQSIVSARMRLNPLDAPPAPAKK